MSVRRAYNLVRQETPAKSRLTFEEFAILCRLDLVGRPVKTSDIVEYQQALRPTMTHRTNHLARMGLIDRGTGSTDRRNIECSISEEGKKRVAKLCQDTCSSITAGRALARTTPERVERYIDAMGALYLTASDLVLLGLYFVEPEPCTTTKLVEELGLLQPTVSMSVKSLVEDGCLQREKLERSAEGAPRMVKISLTDEGHREAKELVNLVSRIVVRRKSPLRAVQ